MREKIDQSGVDIAELCYRYDSETTNYGPKSVKRFLQSTMLSQEGQDELLSELVVVDIQRRIATETAQMEAPLTLEYKSVFPRQFQATLLVHKIAIDEFVSRMDEGQSSDPYSFLSHFGGATELSGLLDAELLRFHSQQIDIHVFGERRFTTFIAEDEPLVIGRQRQDEPHPYSVIFQKSSKRLIAAANDDRRVAREHVELHIKGDDIVISNVSKKSEVLVNDIDSLGAGDSCTVSLESFFRIGDLELRLCRTKSDEETA